MNLKNLLSPYAAGTPKNIHRKSVPATMIALLRRLRRTGVF
ncbi:MAG: hypothetical protein ACYC3T_05320 [Candidatus Humimicrobiaceae bacterium]